MTWPQSTDFLAAVQDLAASMDDKELQGGEVVCTPLGLPMLWAGNFADVFKIHCPSTGNTWALKCFTRPVQGLHDRYRQIASHLERANLPFTVDFQYLERGIRIAGDWFPVLKMRWVEGMTLSRFVEEHLDQPNSLKKLLTLWSRLAKRLREAEITHADLQHGNVLLVPTHGGAFVLRLVDYDGMFVPVLAGTRSGEVGHPAYQHPQRLREGIYNADVDRFSHLAIYTAIRCLMLGRAKLWERFNNGDNLLFREEDFRNPGESKLLRLLWQRLTDIDARTLVGRLILASKSPLEETPLLDEILSNGKPLPLNFDQESAIRAILMPPPKLSATSDTAEGTASVGFDSLTSDIPYEQPPTLPTSQALRKAPLGRTLGTALAPLRALDRLVATIVGPENTLVRNFLRILPVIVVIGVLVGGILHSHRLAVRQRELAAARKMEEATARKAQEEESRRQAEAAEARQRQIEEAQKKAEEESRRQAEEAQRRQVEEIQKRAEEETSRKKADEELLEKTAFGETIRVFNGPSMTSVAFLPNGKQVVTGTMDGGAILWDVATGERIRVFKTQAPGPWIAVNPEGSQLLTGAVDHTVILWDITSGRQIRVFEGNECSTFSPNGKYILTGSALSRRATVWDAATGEQVRVLSHEPNDVVTTVAFSPDGKRIITGCGSHLKQETGKVILWDAETGASIRSVPTTSSPLSIAFSKDSQRISAGTGDGVYLWDSDLSEQIRDFKFQKNSPVSCLAFSPDCKQVLTGHSDGSAILWNTENGKDIHTFTEHKRYVHGVAFSPEGKRVLTGSIDGTAVLWNVDVSKQADKEMKSPVANDPTPIKHGENRFPKHEASNANRHQQPVELTTKGIAQICVFPGRKKYGNTAAFSPDGGMALVANWPFSASLWDMNTGKSHILDEPDVSVCKFSPDGKMAIVGSSVWDVATGERISVFKGYGRGLAMSSDRTRIAVTDGVFVFLLDANTAEQIHKMKGYNNGHVTSAVFSPDGTQLLVGYEKKVAILWDVATGQAGPTFQGHTDSVTAVAFSDRGDQILTGGRDLVAILWDAHSGKQIRVFKGHDRRTRYSAIDLVAISPDGKWLLTGSDDQTAILWNATTGKKVHVFDGYVEQEKKFVRFNRDVVHAAFLGDNGNQVIVGCDNGTAVIWDISGITARADGESTTKDARVNDSDR